MRIQDRHWLIVFLAAVMTAALFAFDLYTPLGVANHILYLGPVLLSFLSPHRIFSLAVSIVCSLLVVLGAALSPDPYRIPLPVALSNRLFGLVTIWGTFFFVYQRHQHEAALQRLNAQLEHRVRARTRELASVNDSLVAEVSERMRTERLLDSGRRELQSLTTQLFQVQEQERRRISRDLHDDINQRLAILIVEMDHLIQQEPLAPGNIGLSVRSVQDRLVELSEEVRKLAYQLHPSILDDLGLSVALDRLASDFESRTHIRCRATDRGGPCVLSQDAMTCLYRVAQESLSNVARHAKASHVELALDQVGRNQILTISDDGIGFDPAHIDSGHGHLGLISMKERVTMAEGTLEVISKPGTGTTIVVSVPTVSEEP